MEAIILAGGFGTRLKPLTYTRSKSLLPILNKPMVSYLIESLPKEINKVILAVNYKKNQIEEYFNNNNFGKEIIVNDEPEPLGTGGAVKFAEKHITDQFFVLNSDIICSINLSNMIKFHKNKNSISTISLWPVDNVSEFGVADVTGTGKIIGFVEKPKPVDAPSNFINAGAYLLEPSILDFIEKNRLVSMEKEIFPQIIQETNKFYGYKFEGFWMDIGRISSYLNINKFLLDKRKIKYLYGENSKIYGKLDYCSIGDNVIINKNSNLKSVVVYDNSKINEGSILENCVVGENCIIGKDSILNGVVVGDGETICENSNLKNEIIWNKSIPNGYPKKQIGNVIKK